MKAFAKYCIRIFSGSAALCLLLGLLLVLMAGSMLLGAVAIPAADVARWVFGGEIAARPALLLGVIRWPRTIACVLCGAALATSGLLLQTALGNSLASPSTIGVNAGAGLFLVVSALLFPQNTAAAGVAVLLGALSACLLVMLVSQKAGASRLTIILAGIAVSSLSSAAIDAIVTLYPATLLDRTAFSIGGFSGVTMRSVLFALPYLALGLCGAAFMYRRLSMLLLGDEVAFSLGIPVRLMRTLAVLCAAVLAAGAVSVCGMVGFVGLIVPHIMRQLLRARAKVSPRYLLPMTMLGGGVLVLLCDLLARTLVSPYEFPVGILLSFLGAPFFLYLILTGKRGRLLQ